MKYHPTHHTANTTYSYLHLKTTTIAFPFVLISGFDCTTREEGEGGEEDGNDEYKEGEEDHC